LGWGRGGEFEGLGALCTEMGTETDQPSLDARLAAVARRQYGVITRKQLRAVGLGEHGIAERVRTRRLIRLHRGVYALGHDALKPQARWLAAVLACGDGAVLSHASAAAHWKIRQTAAATIDVTVPVRTGRGRRKGIRVHRSGRLRDNEVTIREGIATTTVERTLLDPADALGREALKRTIDEAEYLGLLDLTSLIAVVESNPGRRGATLLRLAGAQPERTRTDLEASFLALVQRYGLPRPLVNAPIGEYEADFFWPAAGLVVETDGLAAHGTRTAMVRDRRRDRQLKRAGIHTMRLTDDDLREEAAAIAEDIWAELREAGGRAC
jgi:very-short-patch-repair endonuclease